MKFDKFKDFLNKSKNSDVKLLYKMTKFENGKYMLKVKGIELSEEQLKELGINVKTSGSDIVPRESKPPKWAQELISKVNSIETTPPKWFQEWAKEDTAWKSKIESLPTIKKELSELNKNND